MHTSYFEPATPKSCADGCLVHLEEAGRMKLFSFFLAPRRTKAYYPIPWSALSYVTSLDGFRTSITEQQLKDMPN